MKSASEIMKMCQNVDTAESKLMSALNLAIKLGRKIDQNSVVREENSEIVYHMSNQNILKGLQYEVNNLAGVYYTRINELRKLGIKIRLNELFNSCSQSMSDLNSYTDIQLPKFEPYELGGDE